MLLRITETGDFYKFRTTVQFRVGFEPPYIHSSFSFVFVQQIPTKMGLIKQSPGSFQHAYFVAILSSLLLVFSLITLVSQASSIQLLTDNRGSAYIAGLEKDFPKGPLDLPSYPQKLATNVPGLVLTTACLCMVLATILVICIVRGIRQRKPIKVSTIQVAYQRRK
jgi:hypothetical protein